MKVMAVAVQLLLYKYMDGEYMNNEELRTILKIDNEAKDNIKLIEAKNNELEKYIAQEISVKEAAMEAKYKEEILRLEQEYNNKLKTVEDNLKFKTNATIENGRRKFEERKNQIIHDIVSSIINAE